MDTYGGNFPAFVAFLQSCSLACVQQPLPPRRVDNALGAAHTQCPFELVADAVDGLVGQAQPLRNFLDAQLMFQQPQRLQVALAQSSGALTAHQPQRPGGEKGVVLGHQADGGQ